MLGNLVGLLFQFWSWLGGIVLLAAVFVDFLTGGTEEQ